MASAGQVRAVRRGQKQPLTHGWFAEGAGMCVIAGRAGGQRQADVFMTERSGVLTLELSRSPEAGDRPPFLLSFLRLLLLSWCPVLLMV